MRWQGMRALDRLRASLEAGGDPVGPIAHGALILVAGMLLIMPGFFTDALGLLLLIPAVRAQLIRLGRLAGDGAGRRATSGRGGRRRRRGRSTPTTRSSTSAAAARRADARAGPARTPDRGAALWAPGGVLDPRPIDRWRKPVMADETNGAAAGGRAPSCRS